MLKVREVKEESGSYKTNFQHSYLNQYIHFNKDITRISPHFHSLNTSITSNYYESHHFLVLEIWILTTWLLFIKVLLVLNVVVQELQLLLPFLLLLLLPFVLLLLLIVIMLIILHIPLHLLQVIFLLVLVNESQEFLQIQQALLQFQLFKQYLKFFQHFFQLQKFNP